jgi:type IV secretory pathway ATPase VirB11/archaellum biosynthesis ATPase
MLSAGGQVATQTDAPASARALAMANPKPASSATPAMRARLPERSMVSIRRRAVF